MTPMSGDLESCSASGNGGGVWLLRCLGRDINVDAFWKFADARFPFYKDCSLSIYPGNERTFPTSSYCCA
jgi:hypothetical protein